MSVEELDALLGDPRDAENPVGYAAVLAADERQEMLADGERLLDGYAMNAEFVPSAYGGRLTRIDRLAEILRAVWRRDPSLGLGYGFSSFIASVNIWTAGDEGQCRNAAKLLLSGGRIAAAFHELAHGTDFAHAEFTARSVAGGWSVSGRKDVVTNLRRAEAMVLFARTGAAAGSRSHSQFFVRRDDLPGGRMTDTARFASSGMRGVALGGAVFVDCPIPGDSLIGKLGEGMEIALRAYQITRAVFPSMIVGSLDTALRLVVEYALEHRLYGGTVADIPYVRAVIARAHADLLAVDAFSAVAVRALHLVPEAMAVYAPAAKYLGSRVVLDAFEDLRTVLGAQSYLRQGPYAMFQKLARDLAPATFAHVSRAACLVMLLPQLPRLARRSWLVDPPAPGQLFDLGGELPALRAESLTAGMPRGDAVLGALADIAEHARDGDPAGRFAVRFRDDLRALRDKCATLSASDITIDASPAAFELADRYTVTLAAASVLGVWRKNPDSLSHAAFLAILDRLNGRLGGPSVLTAAEREDVEHHMFDEAVARHGDRVLFDLTARLIPG